MIDFKSMNYIDLISFLNETNRCPGGKDTINWLLRHTFANQNTVALEIGSNTGFSSLEVARTIKCKITGIDVSQKAVEIANNELSRDVSEIQKLVDFKIGSAYDIPFSNNSFDLIIAGGSTSFMDDKNRAISEMERVLKPWGFLTVTNLYYHTPPPQSLLDRVSNIIRAEISPHTAQNWIDIYKSNSAFEVYKFESVRLNKRSPEELNAYVEFFMHKPQVQELSSVEQKELKRVWSDILNTFNENHKYLGFIRAVLRKRYIEEEPELFKLA